MQTNLVFAPFALRSLYPPVLRVRRLTLVILNLQEEAKWVRSYQIYPSLKTTIFIKIKSHFKNTYKELKINAAVRVEIFKGHSSRFLQAHSVGQRCSALICVWGYIIALWSPGWAGERSAAETVWWASQNWETVRALIDQKRQHT